MTSEGRPVELWRAAAAGAVGTGVMTALWLVEPSIGLPRIAVGQILGTFMSVTVAHLNVGTAGGWIVHLGFGILAALAYARFVVARLTGPSAVRGAIYGLLMFALAQTVFMPLVGAGFLSRGDLHLLVGSLLGHLVYGIVVGWIYDLPVAAGRVTAPLPH
jgi:uncharacterized membrane protein YagU involved in acid resistance